MLIERGLLAYFTYIGNYLCEGVNIRNVTCLGTSHCLAAIKKISSTTNILEKVCQVGLRKKPSVESTGWFLCHESVMYIRKMLIFLLCLRMT